MVELELDEPATVTARVIDRDEQSGTATIVLESVVLKVPLIGGLAEGDEGSAADEGTSSGGCVGE